MWEPGSFPDGTDKRRKTPNDTCLMKLHGSTETMEIARNLPKGQQLDCSSMANEDPGNPVRRTVPLMINGSFYTICFAFIASIYAQAGHYLFNFIPSF